MKKLLLMILALLTCALPVGAEEATPTPTQNSVVEGGYTAPASPTPIPTPEPPPLRDDPMLLNVVEIAHRIDILAENERFRVYYFQGMEEQVEKVSYGEHVRPAQVFHLPGQTLIDALYAGADPSQLLDFTRPELMRDLVGELPELLWGRREQTELSILSTLGRYKIFVMDEAYGCGVFFLLYTEAAPVMVIWTAENNCVSVAAFFMPDQALAAVSDANAMSAWFAEKGMPLVAFEEVPLT